MSVVERIQERRVAPRAEARFPAIITERAEKADLPCDEEVLSPLFGETLNLSERGVYVEVDEPLCVGRPVFVTLEVRGRCLRLAGRVARSMRVRGARRFRLGIEFAGLDDAARALLCGEIRKRSAPSIFN
jgi:hypothetical protein